MSDIIQFPRQMLSINRKGNKWRKEMLDWASSRTFFNSEPVRKSVENKKINYDLLNGILHMNDIERVLDPDNVRGINIPGNIQHYPIMNTKLEVLHGEEFKRTFDYHFVVTNPTAITELEEAKMNMILQSMQAIIEQSQSDEEAQKKMEELSDFSMYKYQDIREMRVNALMNHYSKEQDFHTIFNTGFVDAYTVGEEIYQCDVVGGEPVLTKLDPIKVRVFKSGYSNRIEDADVIIIEDYWNPGKIIDTYYQDLSSKDIEYLENMPNNPGEELDKGGNIDERAPFRALNYMKDDIISSNTLFDAEQLAGTSLAPYDTIGNIRVLRLYWKSKRKIKKVKSYDPMTGEEMFNFYSEDYVINKDMGEEEEIYWINQAWEGTKIGEDIYVRMRPMVVQYNSLTNPSACHFGIIGSIYNHGDSKPFSLVDRMKPYNYLYDVIHDRLNKIMARNWGKILRLDLAKVPTGWNVDKWMYYAQVNGLAIENSFNAPNEGPGAGKLAGAMNNATSGVIDADWGNNIQQYINLLEYIKTEMSDAVGISKQREGQISNRETVGGVERATLQSSHITEWIFITHESVKKRTLQCFADTAKIAIKGKSMKFQHILPDSSRRIIDIDGDEFAEADYGIVVDSSENTQKLAQQIDQIAQVALQSQKISLAAVMKMYTSASISEKMHMIEAEEKKTLQQQQELQQQQIQAQQEQAQLAAQQEQLRLQSEIEMNTENNETKILVAQIAASSKIQDDVGDGDGIQEPMSDEAKAKLQESIREFDARLKLDRERLEFDKKKAEKDTELKLKQINKPTSTSR